MRIVALASLKGGVGKSTIVCMLAAYCAGLGLKVAIIDTDKIGTSGNWIEYRRELKDAPKISFMAAEPGERLLQTVLDLGAVYDVVFIDLQGSDSGDNRLLLTLPNTIIFPFGVSQADLDTLPHIKKMNDSLKLLNTKAKFHYLINQAPTTTKREENEAVAWFKGQGVEPLNTIVHARKIFRDCMASGHGATEMGNDKATDEILSLVKEIEMGLPLQKSKTLRPHKTEASAIL